MTILTPQPVYQYRVRFDSTKQAAHLNVDRMQANLVSVDEFSLFNSAENLIRFNIKIDEKQDVLHDVMEFANIFHKKDANIIVSLLSGVTGGDTTRILMTAQVKDVRIQRLDYELVDSLKVILECSYSIQQIV